MKRAHIIALCAALLLPLCSCAPSGARSANVADPSATPADGRISVVTTLFAPYDFVRAVGGDFVDATMLLPPASESHSFEPTPQDIIRIQNSALFVHVGGESDAWIRGVLDAMDPGPRGIVTLMDCVEVVEEEVVEGMEAEGEAHGDEEEAHGDAEEAHGHGDAEEPEYDEHVWTSPRNAQRIVRKIADALCEVDPAHAQAYRDNAAAYDAELAALDAAFQDVVDHAARKTIVFGDRFPFRYLADAYGLTYYAAFPGCSTETEPSAATIKFLIDEVRAEAIPVVFTVELSNGKMANTISEATGARVRELHACHNISRDDFLAGIGYLDLMRRNVDALKEALQ